MAPFDYCAGFLTLVSADTFRAPITPPRRQPGVVLTGDSDRFPFYSVVDPAGFLQADLASGRLTVAHDWDGMIPEELLLERGNARDSEVPENPVTCWWTATPTDWACVPFNNFGRRREGLKDRLGIPREEYRAPVAINVVPSLTEKKCPYPYKDRRFTALTFCFNNREEARWFKQLKTDAAELNRLYAASGHEPISVKLNDYREQIVASVDSAPMATLDNDTAAILYEAQLNDALDVALRDRVRIATEQFENALINPPLISKKNSKATAGREPTKPSRQQTNKTSNIRSGFASRPPMFLIPPRPIKQ